MAFGVCGSPETVARMLREQIETATVNDRVGQFAFGDLNETEMLAAVEPFRPAVIPALKEL